MATSNENQVVGCHTLEQWDEQLKKGESKKLVVIDFTASWCGPCRLMTPVLAETAKKMPDVLFLKVDVDELKSVAEDWGVESMPMFMLLKEGKIVSKIVGARKDELLHAIVVHSASAPAATDSA